MTLPNCWNRAILVSFKTTNNHLSTHNQNFSLPFSFWNNQFVFCLIQNKYELVKIINFAISVRVSACVSEDNVHVRYKIKMCIITCSQAVYGVITKPIICFPYRQLNDDRVHKTFCFVCALRAMHEEILHIHLQDDACTKWCTQFLRDACIVEIPVIWSRIDCYRWNLTPTTKLVFQQNTFEYSKEVKITTVLWRHQSLPHDIFMASFRNPVINDILPGANQYIEK